jgi:hypothetical protein
MKENLSASQSAAARFGLFASLGQPALQCKPNANQTDFVQTKRKSNRLRANQTQIKSTSCKSNANQIDFVQIKRKNCSSSMSKEHGGKQPENAHSNESTHRRSSCDFACCQGSGSVLKAISTKSNTGLMDQRGQHKERKAQTESRSDPADK